MQQVWMKGNEPNIADIGSTLRAFFDIIAYTNCADEILEAEIKAARRRKNQPGAGTLARVKRACS